MRLYANTVINRRVLLVFILSLTARSHSFSQASDTIEEKDISRIINYLASDSLKGRDNGRPELLTAAVFIGNEFKKNDLRPLPGYPSYFISFRPFGGSKSIITDFLLWNGNNLPADQFLYIDRNPGNYPGKTLSDFKVIKLDTCITENILKQFADDSSSLLLWTDKKQPDGKEFFPGKLIPPSRGLKNNILLVFAETPPGSLTLTGNPAWYSKLEYNVVGVLPGKTMPTEVILFSAHYDHIGVYDTRPDSIMNGANDDASGTTALIALADYFSKRNDNERTIMFCAFAGEELGLLGSSDFVNIINANSIVAGINIEMIGIPQFGRNRVFITGEKYSNLPDILRKGFRKTRISVSREPDERKELFKRSDNYSFVKKDVPAHTIMASDDDDKCYHQPCDEIRRIDVPNMTRIIRAIADAAEPLINGKETPGRIPASALK